MRTFHRMRAHTQATANGWRKWRAGAARFAGVPSIVAIEWPANRADGFGLMSYFAHATAVVDQPCQIGDGTKIWHFAHICSGATIGDRCVFGQNTMVANDVKIASNVKVQNNVAIYTGTMIEDDVFLG